MKRAIGLLMFAACGAAQGAIHAALSAEGRLLVADRPLPGSRPFHPLRTGGPVRGAGMAMPANPDHSHMPARYAALLAEVAGEHALDVALLHAVVAQESGYDPAAISPAGAVGLMQLMPATARRFGVRDRFDPRQNLRGGAAYLAWLLRRFDDDVSLALAAYNAGEGAVRRYGNAIPPFAETRAYVRQVRARYGR